MNQMLEAIVADDVSAVKRLLQADPALVVRQIPQSIFYDSRIFHWIYAGDTVLHLAAAGYRVEIVDLLVGEGADPKAAGNSRHSTPFHYAADGFITGPAWDGAMQVETLRSLLENGANLHGQDRNGATALHRAVRTRCADAVRYLLAAGSDPEARNHSGSTPFHLAVQNTGRGGSGADVAIRAQRQILHSFLSAGASTQSKNCRGMSVKECARSSWIRDLLEGASGARDLENCQAG